MIMQTGRDGEAVRDKITCREIADGDIEDMATLLSRGFPARSRDYWLRGLKREQVRTIPEGYPRYGYLLEHQGRAVGVVLVLYAQTTRDGQPSIMCNVGSWYVDEAFRGHGPRLLRSALNRDNVYGHHTLCADLFVRRAHRFQALLQRVVLLAAGMLARQFRDAV